ncbi:hypothetical protein KP77_04090 [Jeotgalibacillus alimentarius]|uniref:Stage IV sporulation protein n=1 Tax=Jeotgalibacillus alimentarius TaxID=135826 RepID=A0A0C2WBK8_9BACL|nr:sporulation protein YqfD [Jeotgalibacillus alimentarius]KIL53433.1 hypothetical protein KP77_04090 [Jeotgalibacillus alimentarius]
MLKQWVRVKVKIRGEHTIQVINRLLLNRIEITDLKQLSDSAEFIIRYSNLGGLRKAVRKTGCSISLSRTGNQIDVFFRSYLPSAAACLIAVTAFLYAFQYIWSIEIKGANPEVRAEAAEILKDHGIKAGVLKSELLINLQSTAILYKHIEQLSWAEIEEKGSRLIITLREKTVSNPSEDEKLMHLIASKAGTVHTLSVSAGTPAVKKDDVVSKGDILVSGYIGREDHEKPVMAKGSVQAVTWYTANVSMPLESRIKKYTGSTYRAYALKAGSLTTPYIPVKRQSFELQTKRKQEKQIEILGFATPFHLITETYKEVAEDKQKMSEAQYTSLLKSIAAENVLSKVEGKGKILEEKILHEDIENGTVKLTIFYQVLENIAVPKPFIEETRE